MVSCKGIIQSSKEMKLISGKYLICGGSSLNGRFLSALGVGSVSLGKMVSCHKADQDF